MIQSVDAYLFLAIAAIAGTLAAVVLSLLRPTATTGPERRPRGFSGRDALRERLDARPDDSPRVHPKLVEDHEEIPVSEAGPYPRLSARVNDLEHEFKLLKNEWLDKESRVDALVKRLNRLNKIASVEAAPPPPDAPAEVPTTAADRRHEVLRRFRNGG